MNTSTDTAPVADAIAALTGIARRHADFADIASHVLTVVAANLGGVEQLLAGRPGSWEADHVRQLVHGTAGTDLSELMRYRSEPLRIQADLGEAVFEEFGLFDLYDAEVDALAAREAAAYDAVFAALTTPEEQTRIEQLHTDIARVDDPTTRAELIRQAVELVETITDRAAASTHPLVLAHADAEALLTAAHRLWTQDQARYQEAYLDTFRQALTDRGLTLEITIDPDPGQWGSASLCSDPFLDELHDHARLVTPLPMTGDPPDWTHGTPADALRAAGLTYLNRAAAEALSKPNSPARTA